MTAPLPGKQFLIYVTHVDADGPLLRIWGQIHKEPAVKIEQLIKELDEDFLSEVGSIQKDAILLKHTKCCAFHEDGFYRAEVLRSGNGKVQVHFMDYGNVETVNCEDIRMLNGTAEGAQLQALPSVATDFVLAGVLPFKSAWDESLVDYVKHTLRYNEILATVCSVLKNSKRSINLSFNGGSFSEFMVNKKMARLARVEELANIMDMPQPDVQQHTPFNQYRAARPHHPPQQPTTHHLTEGPTPPQNHYNNNFHQKPKFQNQQGYPRQPAENWRQQGPQQGIYVAPRRYSAEPPVAPSPRSPIKSAPKTAQSMVNRVLKYRKYPVLVSFVEDGPLKFAVQPEENLEELADLMKQINNCPLNLLSEPPIPGSVCLGRYSRDGSLRRAVVRSVTDSLQAKVFYIDYGSSEILSHSDIYELPVEFAHPCVFSIRFTLSGVKYLIVSEEMKRYFRQLVEGKKLMLNVVPPEDSPLMQYGHLWDNDRNILDMLIARFPGCTENWPELRPLNKGVKKLVHVCYVEACSKFFVQLDDDIKAVETVMRRVDECVPTAPLVDPAVIKTGFKCLAHCNVDSQWYRAQVVRTTGNDVVVHYVDYGNDEKIPMSNLKVVSGDALTRIPALAIRCILNGFQGKGLCDEVDDPFEHMVIDKALELTVLDHYSRSIVVHLIDKSAQPNLDIYEKMRAIVLARSAEVQNRNAAAQESTGRGRREEETPKKTRKDEENEHKRQEGHIQSQERQEWTNAPQSNQVAHAPRNDRASKDRIQDCNKPNDPRITSNSNRHKVTQPPTPRSERTPSVEKSWNDKDSDTSSRSGDRRGERQGRGGGNRSPRNDYQKSPRGSENGEAGERSPRQSNTASNYPPGRGPRDFGGDNRRPSETREDRRVPVTSANAQKPQPRIPAPNITLGAIKKCELTFVVSPLDFSVVLLPDNSELQGVMDLISEIYQSGGDVIPQGAMKPGMDCVAQFSLDSQWYRATIEEVTPSGAKVLFVDYANTEVVPFGSIKAIKEDVCKLPAQAIRVKLLAARERTWDSSDIEAFTSMLEFKNLEAEFVGLDGKIYEILLTVEGSDGKYLNEQYCDGADLSKAKEASRNRSRKSTQPRTRIPADYAPMTQKWKEPSIDLDQNLQVMVTWMANPHNIFCQSLKTENDFRAMMNDIQRIYVGRRPVEEPLEVGTAVMAAFADDGALYRAEVLALNKLKGNVVRYVDFGNSALVESKKTFRVEKQFMEMPKQAFNCTLKNVVPVNGATWNKSNSDEINKLFNVERIDCCFHEVKDDKYTVGMMVNGKDLAGVLVERGLADFAITATVSEEKAAEETGSEKREAALVGGEQPVRIDISKLENQSLRVKVSNVDGARRFHVLLPSAAECEKGVDGFMEGKGPQVLPKLSKREVCIGSGCLVDTKGGWRRAVVISTSESASFDVRLIDTGAKLVIPMDCMLALPSQLAVMQNQAVECYLKNVKPNAEFDAKFKTIVENKEVIIRVENVDNNRLALTVFDTSGHEITPSATGEVISPLLPMLIIHSTNKVTVSHINHGKSIYLQRTADITTLQSLLDELYTFYSSSGRPLDQILTSQLCAAQSVDQNWYRAKIVKPTEAGALVHYPDYGNVEDVPLSSLKHLEPRHMVRPQLALEVSLSVALAGSEELQAEALSALVSDKEFTVSLHHIRSTWITDLVDPSGSKISETLAALDLLLENSEDKKPEIDPTEPEDLIVGEKYKIAVTHADNPAQFYIQRLRDIATIDALQAKLQQEIAGYDSVEGIPEENLFCAATFSVDGLWYRAEVIDADEDIVTVRFVDFGNTDSITDKNQIKQLSESMKSIKRFGIKCRLDLMPPGEEDWSATTCEKFLAMVTAEEFIDAVLIADGSPKRLELFIGDVSIGDRFVDEKLGIKVHGVEDIEIVHRELDPRSAFVSHINSPSEFWVQEEKFVADLETIADRFVVADMFPQMEDIQEGALCVAKFPEDQNWYRARVLSHGDTGTNVIYVDYGNSAVSTEIRQIPQDIAAIVPLSRKCCLPLPNGVEHWSEKACVEFSRMADEGASIFILDVIEEGETCQVKLILDGKDISEELGDLCEKPVAVIDERLSPLGEETSPNVLISHAVSPGEFWTQAEWKIPELEAIGEHLEHAQSFPPLDSHLEGTICAAQFPEDAQWYRAKILCHSESETDVLYIDYGNSAVTSELRALPEELREIPALATFCSLKLPEDLECWSQGACEKFLELHDEGATVFEAENLAEDDPSVTRLCLKGQDVVEILAPLCKKSIEVIDQELREAGLIKENLDQTSDSFVDVKSEVAGGSDEENVERMIVETETIVENESSSTSGIDGTASSDQSSSSISEMDVSLEALLRKPEDLVGPVSAVAKVDGELTADEIVVMYSQPPAEGAADAVGGGLVQAKVEETDPPGNQSTILIGSEDRGKGILEVAGVDLSSVEHDNSDKLLEAELLQTTNHHSTLLEDQIVPKESKDVVELKVDEPMDLSQDSMDTSGQEGKLEGFGGDLSDVKTDVTKFEAATPAVTPLNTPDLPKIVTSEVEKVNDVEMYSVETESISE